MPSAVAQATEPIVDFCHGLRYQLAHFRCKLRTGEGIVLPVSLSIILPLFDKPGKTPKIVTNNGAHTA
eukprot:scaffold164066_cov15-Prasinocladus_malaysianus.AAC.1